MKFLVVGAGPAGAFAARELARAGRDVLLIDRARFPRDKVCGACLSPTALDLLRDIPLRGEPLNGLNLHAGGCTARLALEGMALSRRALDMALVEAAVAAGAEFRDGVTDAPAADVVLNATGLRGGRIARGSRIGAGVVIEDTRLEPGIVHMAHGRDGYVGMVRVEDGRTAVAAALSPKAVQARGIEATVARMVELPRGLPWRGTPLLTRKRARPWADRTLFIGDAAGYVEPFTGEGIAWALQSARAAAALVRDGWRPGLGEEWARMQPSRRGCRWITRALRFPRLVRAGVALLDRAPRLARPLVNATAWRTP